MITLICKIIESSNFWTAISGFGGAVVGGIVTYYFQKKIENDKRKYERRGLLCKYSLFLDKVYVALRYINNDSFAPHLNDVVRHIRIPSIHTILPEVDIKDPAVELLFLVETNDAYIIEDIYNYKVRYFGFLEMFKSRNDIYDYVHQILSERGSFNINTTDEKELQSILGLYIYGKLKTATDSIYNNIDYIEKHYLELTKKLRNIFMKNFPKSKMIELVPKNAA